MADSAAIEIDLSDGETVSGSISPGYRFVIATDEDSAETLSIERWAENHPVMIDKNFVLEYSKLSAIAYAVRLYPYNIAGKKLLQITPGLRTNRISPALVTVLPGRSLPVILRASEPEFSLTVTDQGAGGKYAAAAPPTKLRSQKTASGYRLEVAFPDSSITKQYIIADPKDGKAHFLAQGSAPAAALPYLPAGGGWKI